MAGWRRERMPTLPEGPAFELAPDWVCEVLSPSTRRIDMTEKRDLYGANGVGHLWFVDPQARVLEDLALDAGRWRLVKALKDDDEASLAPFEAVTFPLSALWVD